MGIGVNLPLLGETVELWGGDFCVLRVEHLDFPVTEVIREDEHHVGFRGAAGILRKHRPGTRQKGGKHTEHGGFFKWGAALHTLH